MNKEYLYWMVHFQKKCGDCITDLVNLKSKCIRLFSNSISVILYQYYINQYLNVWLFEDYFIRNVSFLNVVNHEYFLKNQIEK